MKLQINSESLEFTNFCFISHSDFKAYSQNTICQVSVHKQSESLFNKGIIIIHNVLLSIITFRTKLTSVMFLIFSTSSFSKTTITDYFSCVLIHKATKCLKCCLEHKTVSSTLSKHTCLQHPVLSLIQSCYCPLFSFLLPWSVYLPASRYLHFPFLCIPLLFFCRVSVGFVHGVWPSPGRRAGRPSAGLRPQLISGAPKGSLGLVL